MTIRIGDRVRHRDPAMHRYYGEGIVRYAEAGYVSWLPDNGTGDRYTAGNCVPRAGTSQMIIISSAARLPRKPGDPPMRYGPYKPIPKALP
jgi:hypothetical protein